ncbi:MAG: hypothetical protein WBI94_00980, partial [Candidatus Cloacimonadaceae bacterium]
MFWIGRGACRSGYACTGACHAPKVPAQAAPPQQAQPAFQPNFKTSRIYTKSTRIPEAHAAANNRKWETQNGSP